MDDSSRKNTPDKRRRVLLFSSVSGDKNTRSSKQTFFNQISEISKENKKPYSAFLIDRPFNKDQPEITAHYLMNCLRYHLRLSFVSDKDDQVNTNNSGDCVNFEEALQSFMLKSSTPSNSKSSSVKRKRSNEVGCFYDLLLQLIDEFDAAGVAEVFRLLLERRNAIPLFSTSLKIHYMNLLQHITMPGNNSIRLGEDKTFLRVAVVSCRQRNESQTCQILKNLFNITSIHAGDFKNGCVTSSELTAELGIGCILVEDSGKEKVKNLLVVHVVGDFRPLWPFLFTFSDYLLIEDAAVETNNLNSYFVKGEEDTTTEIPLSKVEFASVPLVCLWKPSLGDTRCEMKQAIECGFRHLRIEGQLGDKTVDALKATVNIAQRGEFTREESVERLKLSEIPLLGADYSTLNCPTTANVESRLAELTSTLGLIKKNEFVLQKNFKEQAKLEEAKYENRLDLGKVKEQEAAIKKCYLKRRADARIVQNHPLLQLLLELLAGENSCTRVLSVRMLEKSLAERSERELASQLLDIRNKYTLYIEQSIRKDQTEVNLDEEVARENLRLARSEFSESVLNIEHIWRELSHAYTALTPKQRSVEINNIPLLAAQHLLDGFCLELLDGDSNLIHLEWMKCVLHELAMLTGNLRRERIFVLSVMGVQSSGKSTLLNTMFGIQMRTSVGQCTRGVNMQLLSVKGRPEYDYILLLDTEGTRSPEYHDLPGSGKRDNQMATLSILLADATIVVTPGENDAAIKEILPIVMMAYQGSKLAEANGGRQSSMMFFVYNRIDTTQKDKLDNIVQALGTSLNEAFDQVENLAGNVAENRTDTLFRGFKLDTANSSESDVCILGNVKKEFSPPGDVPDPAFGEALAQLREHIHQRVTSFSEEKSSWRGRSIEEFSQYLEEVWKCICSANFTLNFASVVERITFDKMDLEYKSIEQKLAEGYRTSFGNLKKKMIEENGKIISSSTSADNSNAVGSDESRLMAFESLLRDDILHTERVLDEEVKAILKIKGREKWSLQFQELWRVNKIEQSRNWSWSLKSSFNALFNYEHNVEQYKKKMRKQISQLFKSPTSIAGEWNESQLTKFNKIYTTFLKEASRQFPPMDVTANISRVYQNSNVIKKRQIDINVFPDEHLFEMNYESELTETSDESEPSHQNLFSFFRHKCAVLYSKITNRKSRDLNQSVVDCYQCITRLANKIAAGKLCYDDSIISSVICDIDATITSFHITINSEVQMLHIHGHALITKLMKTIQEEWEVNNSVYAKLKQKENKDAICHYFMMSSLGVEKTKLFASTLANVLKNSLATAFEKEMVQRTSNAIRNERWLHDARFMYKHIDLYLISLLEKKRVDEVLDYIFNPKILYRTVLHRLIAKNVPDACQEWNTFSAYLKRAFQAAGLASVGFTRMKAEMFVSELRKELLKSGLNEYLSTVFLMDFEGEFESCDKEEKNEFQAACVKELIKVLEDFKTPSNKHSFALELSPKVGNYLKLLNDAAALPRCDVCCPLCKSLCVEAANHDTKLRPHDAIHQPAGIMGSYMAGTDELVYKTCSQDYEKNCTFRLKKNDLWHEFKDFGKVFPDWKDPRINEELPVREYILATYNQEIANKYHRKPCPDIPAHFNWDLSSIRAQLERETRN